MQSTFHQDKWLNLWTLEDRHLPGETRADFCTEGKLYFDEFMKSIVEMGI